MTSEQWDDRYSAPDLVWTAAPNRFLEAEARAMVPGKALDLACGEGRNAVWLAAQGWDVTGVDFSPAGIDKAARLAETHGVDVSWEVADLTMWRPSTEFDLVIVFYLHLPPEPMHSALACARDALAPAGTLLIVGHALRNLTDGYGGPPIPDGLYSPDDLMASLDGLIIERAEEVLRPVETDDGTRSAIDTLVRARRPAG